MLHVAYGEIEMRKYPTYLYLSICICICIWIAPLSPTNLDCVFFLFFVLCIFKCVYGIRLSQLFTAVVWFWLIKFEEFAMIIVLLFWYWISLYENKKQQQMFEWQ